MNIRIGSFFIRSAFPLIHRELSSAKFVVKRTRSMPNGVKKENLPSKICVVCERPYTWRKKWERCWDEVTTCSKGCNAKRRSAKQQSKGSAQLEPEDRLQQLF